MPFIRRGRISKDAHTGGRARVCEGIGEVILPRATAAPFEREHREAADDGVGVQCLSWGEAEHLADHRRRERLDDHLPGSVI
jgi:hypothetical protein